MALESKFQATLKKRLLSEFPGCLVGKVDFQQGIPDLLILYNNKWALLECKKAFDAERQPNQEYYVSICNRMSFSRFIYPENVEEVLYELHKAFGN